MIFPSTGSFIERYCERKVVFIDLLFGEPSTRSRIVRNLFLLPMQRFVSMLLLSVGLLGTAAGALSTSHGYQSYVLPRATTALGNPYQAMLDAVSVMQTQYFTGSTWPSAIDWTRAVINTQLSAADSAIVWSNESPTSLIDKYFSQTKAFYNGEDYVAVEGEAYDDMQWVVLEWLEAIKFVNLYTSQNPKAATAAMDQQSITNSAHRANQFWHLASQGWNTTLCGGGMLWNPRLTPYKNAITNELYVSSSVGMYLYFPGDSTANPPVQPHDPKFLSAAIDAYKWLKSSNMTNAKGLYVDGFHISGWTSPNNTGSGKCDQRDESVYTYNQGVLLSGLRGLWEATGTTSYLDDGHALIKNVIAATGWPATSGGAWAGMGTNGILQDTCDATQSCSQDSQTFKGIFFHHIAIFCEPFSMAQDEGSLVKASAQDAPNCGPYADWIRHNAEAAYSTRNSTGDFGMYWGAYTPSTSQVEEPADAADVRNKGVPDDKVWRRPDVAYQQPAAMVGPPPAAPAATDPNNNGRGRTVETQQGGLAVLRALVQALGGK